MERERELLQSTEGRERPDLLHWNPVPCNFYLLISSPPHPVHEFVIHAWFKWSYECVLSYSYMRVTLEHSLIPAAAVTPNACQRTRWPQQVPAYDLSLPIWNQGKSTYFLDTHVLSDEMYEWSVRQSFIHPFTIKISIFLVFASYCVNFLFSLSALQSWYFSIQRE